MSMLSRLGFGLKQLERPMRAGHSLSIPKTALGSRRSPHGSSTPSKCNVRHMSTSSGGSKPLVNLSAELAAVVGSSSITRQEALKGVWAYIKANNLQDPMKKREIVPDEKLRAVFGKDRATMYEVMKLMGPHMTKP